jgi:hypothetical protein
MGSVLVYVVMFRMNNEIGVPEEDEGKLGSDIREEKINGDSITFAEELCGQVAVRVAADSPIPRLYFLVE